MARPHYTSTKPNNTSQQLNSQTGMSTIEVMVACAMACELEDPWLQEFG